MMMLSFLLGSGLALMINPPIVLEAEDGVIHGLETATRRVGYSGAGYLTGFHSDDQTVSWSFPAKAGIYTARVRYSSPGQNKGFGLRVNGLGLSAMFPPTGEDFAWHTAGRVELIEGVNKLDWVRGWGYYDLDRIEFVPAPPPEPVKPVPLGLSNPNASPEAKRLFEKLARDYGKFTWSGQYGDEDTRLAQEISGRLPAILGGDLMDYSPSRVERGADPKGEVERLISAARRGAVITLSWHWNAPKDLLDKEYTTEQGETINARWYKGFYTNATTFDISKAMSDSSSEEYRLLVRDIDVIAAELRKFADAKVPVLWRPLHEAEGGWFWWGAKGPEPCLKLWRLMFDRLTNHHRLNNLIWVWNSVEPAWYPGDETVDIVGADLYPADGRDALTSTWDPLFARLNGKKMIALTEIGGVPDVDRMWRFGVRWSYFVSWTGDLGPRKTPRADVQRTYRSERVRTLDEL